MPGTHGSITCCLQPLVSNHMKDAVQQLGLLLENMQMCYVSYTL